MVAVIGSVAALLLVLVSGIHVYWAFGGRWGGMAAVPQKIGGEVVFRPRKPETIAVAVLLLVAGVSLLTQARILTFLDASSIIRIICIICSVVFLLRTIGEFNYVGLFKRIKHTAFAVNDTKYYTPLCLFLGVAFLLALLK